jgi:succinate dehydrogenase / fumarate reductase cytochrome b subunit
MDSFGSIAWSSVGKKVITGITGLALFGFICVHLLGNLTLFIGPHAFNAYAHFLEGLMHGSAVYALEAGLIAIFVFHMVSTFYVAWLDKRKARREGYKHARDAGGASKKTLASKTMIYTGILIILFVIGHVWMFKFGDHAIVTHDGTAMKDLYSTVVAAFKQPGITGYYVFMMILLGLHLRHGFWSAFQSLGWANDRFLPVLINLARVFSFLLAVGFLVLPLYVFFFVDPASASAASSGGH